MLTFACILTLVLGYFATGLKLKSSFVDLLPEDFKSVRDLKDFQDEFGSSTYLTVLVEHDGREQALRFVRDFARGIEKFSEILYVDYEKPAGYFSDKTLLYVDVEGLDEIDSRIVDYVEQERAGNSPLWQHLMNFTDEPASLDFSDLEEKYDFAGDSTRFLRGRYYENKEKTAVAFLVRPRESSLDLGSNRRVLAKIRALEADLDPSSYGGGLGVGYTGEYQTSLDHHEHLSREIIKVLAIVFLGLMVLVFICYRRLSAVFLIGMPLGLSVVWSAGIVALTVGHINMITSFSGGALLGLGSDYGIYLLSRYWRERRGGKSMEESYYVTYSQTGRATVGALITTVVAFLVLLTSGFRAFAEFGLIGIIGIISAYVSMFVVLPALIALFERLGVFAREERLFRSHPDWKGAGKRFPAGAQVVCAVLAVIVFSLWGAKDLFTIEYDLKKIEDYDYNVESLSLVEKADEVFDNTLRPSVIIADNREQEREIVSALERRSEETPGIFKNVISLGTFVPPNQEIRAKRIEKIWGNWQQISSKMVRNKYGDRFKPIRELVVEEELPHEIRRLFASPREGSDRSLIYIVSGVDRSNVKNIELFGGAIRDISLSDGTTVSASGGWMIFYDIMRILNSLAPRIVAITLIAMFLILALDLRRIGGSLIISFSLLVSFLLFFSLMELAGIRLNILNVAMVPIIIGIGIDSFIHFYYCYTRESQGDVCSTWRKMFFPVLVANMTTLLGFGGFVLSANAGLRSIGWLAIVGVTSIVITSLFFFPALLQLLSFRRFAGSVKTTTDAASPSEV